jgi:hypothetical protein
LTEPLLVEPELLDDALPLGSLVVAGGTEPLVLLEAAADTSLVEV